MPLISVLIPTRNRAHLLKYALQSVLDQDYDDYEVVVSDNDSSDGTREFVQSFSDRHIRYIRPDTYLHAHTHWNFAIQHLRGEYIQLLPDDDCLTHDALGTFARLIARDTPAVIGWKGADYFSPDFFFESQRNQILLPRFSGKTTLADARQVLSDAFQFRSPPNYPAVQAVLVKKSIVDAIYQRVGYFFAPPFPEFVAFPMAFAMAGQYLFIEKPLAVVGRTPDSIGPREFWLNLDPTWREVGSDLFTHVPLKGTYWTNGLAESFLKAKNNLPEKFAGIELSYAEYYRRYYGDMLGQRARGRDIRADQDEFRRALTALPVDWQQSLRSEMKTLERAQFRQSVHDGFLGTARRSSLWKMAATIKRRVSSVPASKPVRTENGYIIQGEQVGVSDILSCAKWLATVKPFE